MAPPVGLQCRTTGSGARARPRRQARERAFRYPRASSATTLHELKTLVLSYHPAIAFDTVEEERVEALADVVGAELEIPVYTWALTRGLVRKPTAHASGETRDPAALLAHLRSLRAHGIYVLRDFARHLAEPAVCRAFRDAAQDLAQAKASMWIVGHGHELPADAAAHIKSLIGVSARVEVTDPFAIERVIVGKARRVLDRRPKT